MNLKAKYELLKNCYLAISSNFFYKSKTLSNEDYFSGNLNSSSLPIGLKRLKFFAAVLDSQLTECPEAYILMSGFQCYALNDNNLEFYALFNKEIPTYAIRYVE